jgi:hypothetical protein
MRARIEENRRRAIEIKLRNEQMRSIQEKADQEADRRAAGEKCLREFGLGSTSKQKLEYSSIYSTSGTVGGADLSFEIENNFPSDPQLAPQNYSPDPRCSAEQLRVLEQVCNFSLIIKKRRFTIPTGCIQDLSNSLCNCFFFFFSCKILRFSSDAMYFLLGLLE